MLRRTNKHAKYRVTAQQVATMGMPDIPNEREWVRQRVAAARQNFPKTTTFPVLESHSLIDIEAELQAQGVEFVIQQNTMGAGWHVDVTSACGKGTKHQERRS